MAKKIEKTNAARLLDKAGIEYRLIPYEFDEPLFKRLFLLAEIGNFTSGELEQYYKSLNNMGDYYNILNTAKEEAERIGLQKGLEQGLEQGDRDRAIKIAREMLADGMPVDKIAKYTDLSVEEIEALRS